jgi:TM2 domain-containing membrane protein YozV
MTELLIAAGIILLVILSIYGWITLLLEASGWLD